MSRVSGGLSDDCLSNQARRKVKRRNHLTSTQWEIKDWKKSFVTYCFWKRKKAGNGSEKEVPFSFLSLKSVQHEQQSCILSLCYCGTMTKCWPVVEKPPPRRLWFIFHATFPTVLSLTIKPHVMLFHAMCNCIFLYVVSCPIGNQNKLPLLWQRWTTLRSKCRPLECLSIRCFVEQRPGLCPWSFTRLLMWQWQLFIWAATLKKALFV